MEFKEVSEIPEDEKASGIFMCLVSAFRPTLSF